jgi:hypothetical protein
MEKREYRNANTACKKQAEKIAITCCYPGCTNKSINTHILQKNGILSKIAPDNHLWQLEIDNYAEDNFTFRRRGLKEVLSFNCFCNEHDTKLFQKIEQGDIDFDDYESCLLFSLRTLYNEKFRKQVNVAHFECLIGTLPQEFNTDHLRKQIEANRAGIEDMKVYEKQVWDDFTNKTESFVFAYRKVSLTELCLSSIFTYDTSTEMLSFNEGQRPAEIVINYFPYKGASILLMGYQKSNEKKVKGYFNRFFNDNEKRLQRQLSNLIMFLCETWVCSDNFYKNRIKGNESYFYDAIKFSSTNPNERRIFDVSIFDSNFSDKARAWKKANIL